MVSKAEAALGLARSGWLVFPLHHHVVEGRCSCGDKLCIWPHNKTAAKHPRTAHGKDDATSDPAQVMAWWGKWPEANIGLITGGGMFVVDVDGEEGWEFLKARGVPETLSVRTGRGMHLYLFAPEGVCVRNRAKVGPELDVRGDGGYVLAPPSGHASGETYKWVDEAVPIADAPEWLVELVRERPYEAPERPATPTLRTPEGTEAYVRAALEGEVDKVLSAGRGSQNDTLNTAAFALGQLVGAGVLAESVAETALLDAWEVLEPGNARGMRAGEKTVRSGLEAGKREPRDIPEPKTRREAPGGASQSTEEPNTAAVLETPTNLAAALEPIVTESSASVQGPSTNGSRPRVEYPIGVWPGPVAEMIAETARAVCVAPEAVGTCVLAVAAGAIGRARWLDVKGQGGWIERPGIYAGLVGEVSRRKSPAIFAVADPLEHLHAEAAARWLKEHDEWESTPSVKGEPELSSLLLKDVTTEVLAHALKAHPRGVILVADELVGWLNGMGQYKGGKGNDRQRWLEAHYGRTIDVRRVGRKPIVVEHPCVGILGGVQPDVFAGLTAVRDGLAERFLYCVMPKVALNARTPDVSKRSRKTWEAIVRELYAMPERETDCAVPDCLTDARQRALDLHAAAPGALEGYLGKGEMHLARIAIVLTALWEVAGSEGSALTGAGVERAEALWGFYADQATQLFTGDVIPVRSFEVPGPAKEQELVAWLRAQGGSATKRQAMNKGPLQHVSSKDADAVIYTVAARGLVAVSEGDRGQKVLTLGG